MVNPFQETGTKEAEGVRCIQILAVSSWICVRTRSRSIGNRFASLVWLFALVISSSCKTFEKTSSHLTYCSMVQPHGTAVFSAPHCMPAILQASSVPLRSLRTVCSTCCSPSRARGCRQVAPPRAGLPHYGSLVVFLLPLRALCTSAPLFFPTQVLKVA